MTAAQLPKRRDKVWAVELAPLTRLTAQLENRSVNALQPIAATEAPQEVHALVTALNDLLRAVERGVRIVHEAVQMVVFSRENRRARGTADRVRDETAVEAHALFVGSDDA